MATLHLHFYLAIAAHYSVDKLANYLRGFVPDPTSKDPPPPDRFDTAGVVLDFQTKAVSGAADFKTSLKDPDSVVVYLGHSVLDFENKGSLGLSPRWDRISAFCSSTSRLKARLRLAISRSKPFSAAARVRYSKLFCGGSGRRLRSRLLKGFLTTIRSRNRVLN
jgi:hypothetical protein